MKKEQQVQSLKMTREQLLAEVNKIMAGADLKKAIQVASNLINLKRGTLSYLHDTWTHIRSVDPGPLFNWPPDHIPDGMFPLIKHLVQQCRFSYDHLNTFKMRVRNVEDCCIWPEIKRHGDWQQSYYFLPLVEETENIIHLVAGMGLSAATTKRLKREQESAVFPITNARTFEKLSWLN